MGIMIYSLLWVMQDFVHQPYYSSFRAPAQESQRLESVLLHVTRPPVALSSTEFKGSYKGIYKATIRV